MSQFLIGTAAGAMAEGRLALFECLVGAAGATVLIIGPEKRLIITANDNTTRVQCSTSQASRYFIEPGFLHLFLVYD